MELKNRDTEKGSNFDLEHFEYAKALLQKGLDNNLYTCAVYCVLQHGEIFAEGAMGTAQPDANPPILATIDTIFDMASISKPITATLLLQCAERGMLHLGMQVKHFLSEAETSPCGSLTLRQLATHSSGLPAWKPLYQNAEQSALRQILATELENEPNTKYVYSDLGYILLGEIIQRIAGKPLDALAKEWIFEPLGMQDTGYLPDASSRSRIAATANCPWREGKILVGEVHDANCHSIGGVSGHAGLFSTAHDIARFSLGVSFKAMFLDYDFKPILSLNSKRLIVNSQIPNIGGHSIGWFTPPNGMLPRGDFLSEDTFGHTGFTGTLLIHDHYTSLTIILLTNRVYSTNEGAEFLRTRWLFSNAVGACRRGGIQGGPKGIRKADESK